MLWFCTKGKYSHLPSPCRNKVAIYNFSILFHRGDGTTSTYKMCVNLFRHRAGIRSPYKMYVNLFRQHAGIRSPYNMYVDLFRCCVKKIVDLIPWRFTQQVNLFRGGDIIGSRPDQGKCNKVRFKI